MCLSLHFRTKHNFYLEDIQFSYSYVKPNCLDSWKQTKHHFLVNFRNLFIPLLFWRKFQLQSLFNFLLADTFFIPSSDSLPSQGEIFFSCWSQWKNIPWFPSGIPTISCICRSHQCFFILLFYKNLCYRFLKFFFSVNVRCIQKKSKPGQNSRVFCIVTEPGAVRRSSTFIFQCSPFQNEQKKR